MGIKIQTTNTPVDDKGNGEIIEVEESEFIDLSRQGLVVKNKGDIDKDGKLKKEVADDASPAVLAVSPGSLSTPGALASASTEGAS